MSSRFIRLEKTKTKLICTNLYIVSVDDERYQIDGTDNTTYGQITITGVGTDFTGELADGDIIQLCSDTTLFNTYGIDGSGGSLLQTVDYKFSMQFETILEEYEVVSRASTTSMIVKPYTNYEYEKQEALNRVAKIYLQAYKDDAGSYQSLRFSTLYKKSLTNSKTDDYVVNIDQIAHFHINSSNAQNMDVHFADTGNGSTRTLTVHNCFEYLNYVLQPYTQIEQQRIFYDYEDTDLTVAQPDFYSNYSYPKSEEFRNTQKKKSDAAKLNSQSPNKRLLK
jgi:hypothetical protein